MSLDGMKFTTKTTQALKPFFDWCLDIFIGSLDAGSQMGLRRLLRARNYKILVTVLHREHKLWEDFAAPGGRHATEKGHVGRVYGATRAALNPRRRHIIHLTIPSYALKDPLQLAMIFVHEFAHVTQNHAIWMLERAKKIPPGGFWRSDAAEADAEAAERQFLLGLFRHLVDYGFDPDGDRAGAVIAAAQTQWQRTLAKSPRLVRLLDDVMRNAR